MYLSSSTLEFATTSFPIAPTQEPFTFSSFINLLAPDGGSQLQRWSSLIGIVTAIVGNILISFALNIQRYAHIKLHKEKTERKERARNAAKGPRGGYGTTRENSIIEHYGDAEENGRDEEEEDNPLEQSFHTTDSQSTGCSDNNHKNQQDSNYLRSPYWWGGIILMTIGEAGNFLAYGFAPASIVSPLGVVALISNCVIAPIMLKERFRMRDFWGVVVAVAGAVTVVLSAKQQEKKLGPHEIWGAITRTEFEVYLGITTFLIAVLVWASPRYGNKTILIDLGLVGLFGGYTALSTKGVASMLSSTLWRAFTTPVTYALLAVLVGTAVMQVKYVNKALQRFDSTQVIPVQFVMFTLSVIIGSAILYRDFEKVTAENVGKFVGGCLLTFFGVYLITSGRERGDDDRDGDSSDEEGEERINLLQQDRTREGTRYADGAPMHPSVKRVPKALNGDSANDDEVDFARRSSHVSFKDPSSRPRTPRMYSNSSYQPSVRVTKSSDSSEQGSAETPLLRNPWKDSADDPLQVASHPGVQSTASSPVLPTDAQTNATDSPKPPTPRSSTQGNVHTQPNLQQEPAPPQAERPPTPAARHSVSRMMPGMLLSPLSGGLSAIVADSLRRGVESPSRNRSFRRPRLGLRKSSGSQRLARGSDDAANALGTSPSKDGDTGRAISKSLEPDRTDWSTLTRARSLSNTIGDLFRGKRPRSERSDAGDEEAGPSGS